MGQGGGRAAENLFGVPRCWFVNNNSLSKEKKQSWTLPEIHLLPTTPVVEIRTHLPRDLEARSRENTNIYSGDKTNIVARNTQNGGSKSPVPENQPGQTGPRDSPVQLWGVGGGGIPDVTGASPMSVSSAICPNYINDICYDTAAIAANQRHAIYSQSTARQTWKYQIN